MAATKEKTETTNDDKHLAVLEAIREDIAGLKTRFDVLEGKLASGKTSPNAVTVKGTSRVCQRGHAMQVSDDYCQHCWREDHPNVQAGRFRPPRANKVEVIPLGDPPTVELDELEPPTPPKSAA